MALTINTHPDEVITNQPEFSVVTSLTEGASYQNLRIRATVYIGGKSEAVAVLEQPKGLDDWEFFTLLKDLTGKCNQALGGTAGYTKPTFGSELLSSWSDALTTFETFTTSGREITSAIDSNASGGLALSNDFGAIAIGEIYVVAIGTDYVDSGAANELLNLNGSSLSTPYSETKYAGLSGSGKLQKEHLYFFHATDDDTVSSVKIGHGSGANGNFTGTFSVHKITDFKNNPGVYFHIKFEEVYENASDVTTVGDTEWSDTLLFVPVVLRPGESFSDYLMEPTGLSGKFLVRSTEHPSSNTWISVNRYKEGINMECRMIMLSVCSGVSIGLTTSGYGPTFYSFANAGWFMAILNDGTGGWAAGDTYWFMTLTALDVDFTTGVQVTGAHYVYAEENCYPNFKALNFVSDLGEETILFKGLQSIVGRAKKSYYKNANRIDKVLKAYKSKSLILRTIYESEAVRLLLHELTYTEKEVWLFDSDESDGYKDVTVLTDEIDIEDQKQLIETEIEVVYYE